MQITSINYEMSNDRFDVALDNGATVSIAYEGPDNVAVTLRSNPGTLDKSPYFNAYCMMTDVLRAIVDAQERDGAELPCDCAMPIEVPNTFTMPSA